MKAYKPLFPIPVVLFKTGAVQGIGSSNFEST